MITGAQIQALRNRLGMSQLQFAQMLGTTVLTVSRWENGHFHPEGPTATLLEVLNQHVRDVKQQELDKLKEGLLGVAAVVALAALLGAIFRGDSK